MDDDNLDAAYLQIIEVVTSVSNGKCTQQKQSVQTSAPLKVHSAAHFV